MLLNKKVIKKVIFKIKDHNIEKRNAPKSLLELASTVDIGNIERFDIDEEHIRNRLVTLNHSIFSRPYFLDAFVFDNIILQLIIIPLLTLSRVVPIRNLEHLKNNCEDTILKQFKNLNPLIAKDTLSIDILKIKQTSAIIRLLGTILYNRKTFDINNNKPFEVNFNADKFILSSLTTWNGNTF
ncbi:hypothetical protein [Spiroplasma endosymbiont of Poecilobothrus nobilitatus]|uniref:hypothetical protein n=1 Tax=Spiroplasma endosymbiont of Poecilobothrus nobilitatus TaxID=1209220 RepID=UPI00313EC348